jgi:phage baseplate assembly protein gpV
MDIRIGEVVSSNPANCTARVVFKDIDNMISAELPILQRNTLKDKIYNMVDIGEQVLCVLFDRKGVILGSLYNNVDTVAIAGQNISGVKFQDDTEMKYDSENHEASVDVNGLVIFFLDKNSNPFNVVIIFIWSEYGNKEI